MENKFNLYEIVKVIHGNPRLQKKWGWDGYISGFSAPEKKDGVWAYSISYADGCGFVFENEIESTGKFANPDDFKPVGTIRVQVQPDGSGKVIDD